MYFKLFVSISFLSATESSSECYLTFLHHSPLFTAVRFGRVPKREKARILAAMQQSSSSKCTEKALAAELDDDQRLLATIARAHVDTCAFTADKVEPMLRCARETPTYTACPSTLVSTFPSILKLYKVQFQCKLLFLIYNKKLGTYLISALKDILAE